MPTIEYRPIVAFTLTIPNSTTLVPLGEVAYGAYSQEIPNNCKVVQIRNLNDTNQVLFHVGLTASTTIGTVTSANSTVIAPNGSFTGEINVEGKRWRLGQTELLNGYLACVAGTNVQVNITYVQISGFFGNT